MDRPVDLHFAAEPFQMGDQMMTRIQVSDNFGVTLQFIWPPAIVRAFATQLQSAAEVTEKSLVKPPGVAQA